MLLGDLVWWHSRLGFPGAKPVCENGLHLEPVSQSQVPNQVPIDQGHVLCFRVTPVSFTPPSSQSYFSFSCFLCPFCPYLLSLQLFMGLVLRPCAGLQPCNQENYFQTAWTVSAVAVKLQTGGPVSKPGKSKELFSKGNPVWEGQGMCLGGFTRHPGWPPNKCLTFLQSPSGFWR